MDISPGQEKNNNLIAFVMFNKYIEGENENVRNKMFVIVSLINVLD